VIICSWLGISYAGCNDGWSLLLYRAVMGLDCGLYGEGSDGRMSGEVIFSVLTGASKRTKQGTRRTV